MKKFKRIIAFVLSIIMTSTVLGQSVNVNAATMINAAPNAYVEKSYTTTILCGTIRYVSQLKNQYFQEEYWGDYASRAGSECATACISMALSYVGLSKTPVEILTKGNGITYFTGWGPVTTDSRSTPSFTFEEAMENYLNGEGKYSPPIVYFSWGHYVLVAGMTSDGTYIVVDPGTYKVTVEYTEEKLDELMTGRVIQYYNSTAVLDESHEHVWGTEYIVDRRATCTKNGSMSTHCVGCDAANPDDTKTINMTGHSFGYWYLTTEPTYTEYGIETRYCNNYNCDETQTRTVDPYVLEEIGFYDEHATVTAGDSIALDLYAYPLDIENSEATWHSSNRSVAYVSQDGTVSGLGAGTSVITASYEEMTAQCVVTVEKGTSYGNTFTDVESGAWYYDEIEYISSNGIMTGVTDTTFEPTGKVTRGAFAVTLHRMSGAEDMNYSDVYSDIYDDMWYTDAVLWASEYGVVNGYADGTFKPGANISRQQIVTMLYRYAVNFGYETNIGDAGSVSGFMDADKISAYAQDAMEWAVGNGILTGKSADTLDPLGEATRAECATIIMRFMQKVLDVQ